MKHRKLLAAGIVAATALLAGCVVVPVAGPGYRWEPHRGEHHHHWRQHGGRWERDGYRDRHDHDGRRGW